jgi:hypothetical protein
MASSENTMRNAQRLLGLLWKIATHGAFIALFLLIIAAVRNMDDSNVYVNKCAKDSNSAASETGCYPFPVGHFADNGAADLDAVKKGTKLGTKNSLKRNIFSECKTGTHILEKNKFDFLDEMNDKVVPIAWTVTIILIVKTVIVLMLMVVGFMSRKEPGENYDNWFKKNPIARYGYRFLTFATVGLSAAALVLFYAGVASRDTCLVDGADFHACAGDTVDRFTAGSTFTGLQVDTTAQGECVPDGDDAPDFDLTSLSDPGASTSAVFITCNAIAGLIEDVKQAQVACDAAAAPDDANTCEGTYATAVAALANVFGDGSDAKPYNYGLMGAYAILCESKAGAAAHSTDSNMAYPKDLRDELIDSKVAIWRHTKAANWMLLIIFLGIVFNMYNESRTVHMQELRMWGQTHMVIFLIIVSMLTIIIVSSVQIYQSIGHDDQASAFESCAFATMSKDERYVMSARQERHADGNLFWASIFAGIVYGGLLFMQMGHKMARGVDQKGAITSGDVVSQRLWRHVPLGSGAVIFLGGLLLALAVFFIIRPLQWQASQTCDIAAAEEVNALARAYVAVVIAISIMASVAYSYVHIGKSGLGQADHSVVYSYGDNRYSEFGSSETKGGSGKLMRMEKMSPFVKAQLEA